MKIMTMGKPIQLVVALSIAGVSASAQAVRDYPAACLDDARSAAAVAGVAIVPTQSVRLPELAASDVDPRGFSLNEREVSIGLERFACNTGKSILVLRIEDPTNTTGLQNLLYPKLSAEQAGATVPLRSTALDDGAFVYTSYAGWSGPQARFALETVWAGIDLNKPFRLAVSSPDGPGSSASFEIPEYLPTPQTTPAAYGPRRITGRYAGNYFDPARSGEGIIIEIGDVPGQPGTHFLQFSWFTFDTEGKPFWISGGGNFSDGDKHLHMPAAFRGGGRFAGSRPAETLSIWGSVDLEFSDCNTLQLDYASTGKFAPTVPVGSGHLQWRRLTGVSNFGCN